MVNDDVSDGIKSSFAIGKISERFKMRNCERVLRNESGLFLLKVNFTHMIMKFRNIYLLDDLLFLLRLNIILNSEV